MNIQICCYIFRRKKDAYPGRFGGKIYIYQYFLDFIQRVFLKIYF